MQEEDRTRLLASMMQALAADVACHDVITVIHLAEGHMRLIYVIYLYIYVFCLFRSRRKEDEEHSFVLFFGMRRRTCSHLLPWRLAEGFFCSSKTKDPGQAGQVNTENHLGHHMKPLPSLPRPTMVDRTFSSSKANVHARGPLRSWLPRWDCRPRQMTWGPSARGRARLLHRSGRFQPFNSDVPSWSLGGGTTGTMTTPNGTMTTPP